MLHVNHSKAPSCLFSFTRVLVFMHHTVSCFVCFHARACLLSCTTQCPALYDFTRVRACCHAPHSVLLCMFSHACLFSCTTQCPALYVFMRVLVLMHHTVSCSVCFYARACVHAHHTVSCSVVNAHPAQWGSLGGTLVHWGFIIMFLDRHSNWGSLIIIHIGVS